VATGATPQRNWRAACPNCGAPVEFASAASPMAVCSFCRSTLARDGESLRRTGQSAELFDDHSPLQIGSAGRWQGAAFAVVGRLQLRYAEGSWNEWHVLFDSGKSGWLSEDNGRYVMAFDQPAPPLLPRLDELQPGAGVGIDARLWQVASVTLARVGAAEGELPFVPKLAAEYPLVDLRNADGEVGTLDFGDLTDVHWSIGRTVELADLALTGLREASEKTLSARGVECPSCGTALAIKLDTTQSIACHQCHAVVDVSQGVGGDLKHYAQQSPGGTDGRPMLPLGATASLALGGAPQDWQIVGYAERQEIAEDGDDESAPWREYLLYARGVGFAFLVDAEDGWSWAVPLTGAPQVQGDQAQWADQTFRKRYDYRSRTRYVAGEFYWRLQRGEETRHADYAGMGGLLNREQGAQEVTWSLGQRIDASAIAAAFKLPMAATVAPEASPLSNAGGMPFVHKLIIAVFVLVLIVMLLNAVSRDECDDVRDTFGAASREFQQCKTNASGAMRAPRTGGGSFGGFGTGGGHK
jgi:Domain of unknown function (DUF4178)